MLMIWSVDIQKIPPASQHFYPAKQQTSCGAHYACRLSILSDFGMGRVEDKQKSLQSTVVHVGQHSSSQTRVFTASSLSLKE